MNVVNYKCNLLMIHSLHIKRLLKKAHGFTVSKVGI